MLQKVHIFISNSKAFTLSDENSEREAFKRCSCFRHFSNVNVAVNVDMTS